MAKQKPFPELMPITLLLIAPVSEGCRRDAMTLETTVGTKDLAATLRHTLV